MCYTLVFVGDFQLYTQWLLSFRSVTIQGGGGEVLAHAAGKTAIYGRRDVRRVFQIEMESQFRTIEIGCLRFKKKRSWQNGRIQQGLYSVVMETLVPLEFVLHKLNRASKYIFEIEKRESAFYSFSRLKTWATPTRALSADPPLCILYHLKMNTKGVN